MDRNEYINRLSQRLKEYDIENIYTVLADYEQIIEEILIDNDNDFNKVIEKLGYPEILADEIASEFGLSPIKPKQRNATSDNQYGKTRQKSNIIWNICLTFYHIFQFCISIFTVGIIIFLVYFGFNTTINQTLSNNLRDGEITFEICSDSRGCQEYVVNTEWDNDWDDDYDNDHYDNENFIISNNNIPIGFLSMIMIIINCMFSTLIYFIVYRPIKKVIKTNNEYNRKRNYE